MCCGSSGAQAPTVPRPPATSKAGAAPSRCTRSAALARTQQARVEHHAGDEGDVGDAEAPARQPGACTADSDSRGPPLMLCNAACVQRAWLHASMRSAAPSAAPAGAPRPLASGLLAACQYVGTHLFSPGARSGAQRRSASARPRPAGRASGARPQGGSRRKARRQQFLQAIYS